jgi:peptidoglycan/xylan/chitin deacetylase (PgdA/CDA1 family)
MVARFVLSFDCEGKWGVADHMTSATHALLTDERLRRAYADILAVLDEFSVAATFAFVGLFSLSRQQMKALRPALEAHSRDVPGYLEPALADLDHGTGQGWLGDWALEAVEQADAGHEIGLHGGTHVPFDWPGMSREVARRDLQLLGTIHAPLLSRVSTFVYPRNHIAHLDVVDAVGMAGYRGARIHLSRAFSLASEFNVLSRPQVDADATCPLQVPSGYFINIAAGPRRIVPQAVSRDRARRMLRHAARTNKVVHYWTHPENIAAAPETLTLLRGIVEDVSRLRDAGRCTVLTQESYCRTRDPELFARAAARRARQLQS